MVGIDQTTKSEENAFWNSIWASEKTTRETERIDHDIPHLSLRFSYSLLGDIQRKKLLEIGCGSGYETVTFSQKGAFVTAIDVSSESVKAAKERCKKNHINSAHIVEMNAEKLLFKDNSFDIVYVNKILMHTNSTLALQECRRVLKKGGLLVMNEMLEDWLFTFPYRTFSPYRKLKPKYLAIKDIKKIDANHREFYLFSTFFLFLFYLRLPLSNKLGYFLFDNVACIDNLLLRWFPFLGNFAWITIAWLRK